MCELCNGTGWLVFINTSTDTSCGYPYKNSPYTRVKCQCNKNPAPETPQEPDSRP